jgi:hypothetical protein
MDCQAGRRFGPDDRDRLTDVVTYLLNLRINIDAQNEAIAYYRRYLHQRKPGPVE